MDYTHGMFGRGVWLGLIAVFGVTMHAAQTVPFRAGVSAVYLDVTVLDANGDVVTGLTKDDFEILDEGVTHDVAVFSAEPSPISIGVLIDTSRSMTGDRITAAIAAATAVGQSLQPKDLWSIYGFSSRLYQIFGWRPFNPSVEKDIKEINVQGGTQLFMSVANMAEQMRATPHRKKALLVITDGADDAVMAARRPRSSIGPTRLGGDDGAPLVVDHSDKAINELRRGEVLLYGMGLNWAPAAGVNADLHVPSLEKLAEPTGGGVAVVRTLAEARGAAQALAAELRTQYTLGFYPQKAPDGKYRRVAVTTKNPSHAAKTRAGYLATRPK